MLLLLLLFGGVWCWQTYPIINVITKATNITTTVVANKNNYFIVAYQQEKYLLWKKYFFHNQTQIINAEIDDEIICQASSVAIKDINNFYDFDFKLFLGALNIKQMLKLTANSAVIVHERFSIRNYLIRYIKKIMPVSVQNYTLMFLFQENNKQAINKIFSTWGIVALLVVSGFHINIFYLIGSKMLFFIKNKMINKIIIFALLFFYLYLLNWPIAAIRAFLSLLIVNILTLFNLKKESLTIFAITVYCCLLFNPLQFYQLGWQLSFGFTFLITVINQKITHINKISKMFLSETLLFLFSIPVQLYINQGFSCFSIFYNIIFSPVIIFYYLLLFVNLLLTPIISCSSFVLILLNLLDYSTAFFQKYDIWIVAFQPETWVLQTFFTIMVSAYFFVKYFNWKIFIIFVLNFVLLGAIWIDYNDKFYYEITMINVGNALSIIISSPNNTNILFDAGITTKNSASDVINHYLKAQGIRKINSVFLTDNQTKSSNNLVYLQKNIIITNLYTTKNAQASYYVNDFAVIKNLNFNNHSLPNKPLVLLFSFFNFKFLFLGNITDNNDFNLWQQALVKNITFIQMPFASIDYYQKNNIFTNCKIKNILISTNKPFKTNNF